MKQDVNYILQHRGAFEKMREMDLSPIHISLYNTLFLIWNYSGWEDKISISRQEVMSMAKIGSAHTYLAALKELDKVGMIKYVPSHNPMKGSIVNLCRFDTTTSTSSGTSSGTTDGTSTDTSSGTTPAPLSKRINSKTDKPKKQAKVFIAPSVEEVCAFFLDNGWRKELGEKAFRHYASGNWRDANDKQVKDWKRKMTNVWFDEDKNGGYKIKEAKQDEPVRAVSVNYFTHEATYSDGRKKILPTERLKEIEAELNQS